MNRTINYEQEQAVVAASYSATATAATAMHFYSILNIEKEKALKFL